MSEFPLRRMRRMRRTSAIRDMVRETRLSTSDLVAPVFVVENPRDAGPVASMPGVSRLAVAEVVPELAQLAEVGVRAVLLFGIPGSRTPDAARAWADDNAISIAVSRIKAACPELCVITDVCLCGYMDHGHCGLVSGAENTVVNDATLGLISAMAVSHARAGADMVAPSGMMDGMVGAIRTALDDADMHDTAILSYAVKYASSFYGPFREAAGSTPAFGDRRAYQMDPANVREAIAEARLDVHEGADMLMVKPAMPCLDVVRRVRDEFPEHPLAAYQVSGEYGMIRAAAERGWLDERAAVLESLTAIKRAGADVIITYFAAEAARLLR